MKLLGIETALEEGKTTEKTSSCLSHFLFGFQASLKTSTSWESRERKKRKLWNSKPTFLLNISLPNWFNMCRELATNFLPLSRLNSGNIENHIKHSIRRKLKWKIFVATNTHELCLKGNLRANDADMSEEKENTGKSGNWNFKELEDLRRFMSLYAIWLAKRKRKEVKLNKLVAEIWWRWAPTWIWIGASERGGRKKGGKPRNQDEIHNVMTFNLTLISFLPPTCFYIFIIPFDNTIKHWTFFSCCYIVALPWNDERKSIPQPKLNFFENIDGKIVSAISMEGREINFWIVRKFFPR